MRPRGAIQAKVNVHASDGVEIAGTEASRRDQNPRRQARARAILDSHTGTTEVHWFSAERSGMPAWK